MLTETELTTFYQAIQTAKLNCNNDYAIAYLNAIDEANDLYGENGVKVNILYALGNMQYWKGDLARKVKKVLNEMTDKM